MASLYRTHRPQRFAELVGQDHVTTALRNAITEDRVGHAYLFSGPRGTGKTTTARLLARALNCLDLGADGEPCGKCENCLAVANGSFFDLVELDAASNNGVEAMRDLIQSVHLGVGASSRRKIYIIDEVHMLSVAASNTLLKTLEEPPPHVVFVLATTDPQKVLPTVRSRTQQVEFTLLSYEQLVGHLADVLSREGIETDAAVLDLVATRAAGSARDALSILDQALAIGGGRLDAEQVQAAFGGAPFEQRVAVLEAAANEDVATVLVGLHDLVVGGHDPRRIADDLLRTLRDAFLLANARGRVPYDGPAEQAERLEAVASRMGNVAVVRAIELMGQAIVDIRGQTVADPRLVLEVTLVRVARREARTREETLLDRVERLEQKLAGTPDLPASVPAPAPPAESSVPAASPSPPAPAASGPVLGARAGRARKAAPAPEVQPPVPEISADASPPDAAPHAPASPLALDDVIEAWPVVLAALNRPVAATIADAQPIAVEDGVIVFGVPRLRLDAIQSRFRGEADNVKQAFASRLGFAPRFVLRAHDFNAPDALRPGPAATSPSATRAAELGIEAEAIERVEEVEDESIDLGELVDAPDAPPDSVARLMSDFGAEVVEERPRE